MGNRSVVAHCVRLLLVLSALPITAAPSPLVDKLVALLERDDAGSFHELAPDSADLGTAWRSATDIVDRYDCIEIESVTAETIKAAPRERLLRVTMRANGVTAGAIRRPEALPNVWFVRAVKAEGRWRVAGIETAEQRLAEAIIAAASDDERRALLDTHADLPRLAFLVAWNSADAAVGERGFPLIRFGREIAEASGDRNTVEYTRHMESVLDMILNRQDESIRVAMESVEQALANGDPDVISDAWFTAAVAHWGNTDIPSAIAFFRAATALSDAVANPLRGGKAWANLGTLEYQRGNLSGSAEAANEAERIARTYGWLEGQLVALSIRQRLEFRLGNYAASRRTGEATYALARRLRQPYSVDMALVDLGINALSRDPDEAIRYFKRLDKDGNSQFISRVHIALALRKKGRSSEAAKMCEELAALAVKRGDTGWAALMNVTLSGIMLRTNPKRALTLVREARKLREQRHTSPPGVTKWELDAAEAAALLALGRRARAETLYESAVNDLEAEVDSIELDESTHTDVYGDELGIYHALIDLKLRGGKTTEALRLGERVKATLLDAIQSGERADFHARVTAEERAGQQKIEAEIARLNRELFRTKRDNAPLKASLAEARSRWESFETTLHQRHALERTRVPIDPLQSPELLLPSRDDVVLDYVVTKSKTILFVLSRDERDRLRVETHTIAVSSAGLQRDVDRFLRRLAGASFDYEDEARRLYRLLLKPAARTLRGRQVIAVVPDGPLWRLPFQALQDAGGQALVERFTLFYAPSLASLGRAPGPAIAHPNVLAVGNPRATAVDLPDAATEARQIVELYDGERSRALIGREATESAVKQHAASYDIVHIAAHAIVDDEQPLYSGIVLASEGGDDGLLEGREITRLHLNARLAVLSACRTASGQVRRGEGLIALSWAFLVAGCPTVVATQWNVPSVSTARLMVDFHRELARGAGVAVALRRAQLRLMKDRRYRHPFYWSPFVVVGAGRS